MNEKVADPIQYIMKTQLGGVLSKAFAQLYRKKPNFPVTYLGNWLKDHCKAEQHKKQKVHSVQKNMQQLMKIQQESKRKADDNKQKKHQQQQKINHEQNQFIEKIKQTKYLQDLLRSWLPNYIQKKYHLSGAYIGLLTHLHKKLEPGNFQPGAELDTENPKVIQYIGSSDSNDKIMHMKILPNQQGISFECFNQPEPQPQQAEPAEGEQPKPPKQPKKTYIFIPDVTKNQKIFYFKFSKLGSYACFPMKLKSVLGQSTFEQAVNQYKQYVKRKQQTQKQYSEKLNQLKNEHEEIKKKFQQMELPEEPTPEQIEQKKVLQEQTAKTLKALQQFQANPPKIQEPNFASVDKCYLLGCDTLGQDQIISQSNLDSIDQKTKYFKKNFEEKQKQMLLSDILAFIQEEPKLDPMELLYRDHQKNAAAQSQQIAKEKNLKDKQLQYEIAVGKTKKMDGIFEDPTVQKSMKTYFNYNTAKYKEILQIALMLLGFKLQEINLPRKNTLDFRKVSDPKFVEKFMKKLVQFDLRPQSAVQCPDQYKINKLLQRLQKIDLEQVLKYNGFIWILANHIKSYCWALILCRDAKKQAYEQSVKNQNDRNAEIQKYRQDRQQLMDKAIQAAKAEQTQQNPSNFNQQQWINNYVAENPEPQTIEAIQLQEYLNID